MCVCVNKFIINKYVTCEMFVDMKCDTLPVFSYCTMRAECELWREFHQFSPLEWRTVVKMFQVLNICFVLLFFKSSLAKNTDVH